MTVLLDIPATHQRTGIPEATLRHWIHNKIECGPLFGKFGRRRLIRASDLDAWIDGKVGAA